MPCNLLKRKIRKRSTIEVYHNLEVSHHNTQALTAGFLLKKILLYHFAHCTQMELLFLVVSIDKPW